MTARAGGSNSWVLVGHAHGDRPAAAGQRSRTCKWRCPPIWYEAHVVAAGLDVAGVTLPGAPFVIIGHNSRIAWGLDEHGRRRRGLLRRGRGHVHAQVSVSRRVAPARVTSMQIDVRGHARPEAFDVFSTRHGPLVATETDWESRRILAARRGRRSARAAGDAVGSHHAGRDGRRVPRDRAARRLGQFLRASADSASPSQNFVYADVDGHIGYAMSGRLPMRKRQRRRDARARDGLAIRVDRRLCRRIGCRMRRSAVRRRSSRRIRRSIAAGRPS